MARCNHVLHGAAGGPLHDTDRPHANCIRAVYKGAPDDYAQVQDIPDSVLIQPDDDGRYQVERGQQITVVTAARLPEGYTRFYLQRQPLQVTVSPTSSEQLIPPGGTTYTFTATSDERGSTLLTFDLTAARPLPISRPGIKPELGDVVVTAAFQVETTTLRYRTYATTGAVTTAGSYAFLSDTADTTSAVSTYEGLRDGATTGLLIHKSDTHGASRAALYDAVEADDLFEWRHADDCWVRYAVTEVKPDPTGIVPRKLLAVEWMTYAFTGCSGTISANAAASLAWGPLPDVGGTSLTSPVRHGPYQLTPEGWSGQVEEPETHVAPGYSAGDPTSTSDLAVARQLPYWRDPRLPGGWTLVQVTSGYVSDPGYGYWARFKATSGGYRFDVEGYHSSSRAHPVETSWLAGRGVAETRVIAGRPGRIYYSPLGPSHDEWFPVTVWVYDPATEAEYIVLGKHKDLRGNHTAAAIAIARSLFAPRVQLTGTAGAGGSVEPTGITTHAQEEPVTLTASWNDATHTFGRWSGDCSGTATTCVLTIYANKTAMATFTPLARNRCATPTAADCTRAVYKGAPDDYAQVQDIPDSLLIQPEADGRYQVERGQQITVVTAAQLTHRLHPLLPPADATTVSPSGRPPSSSSSRRSGRPTPSRPSSLRVRHRNSPPASDRASLGGCRHPDSDPRSAH